MTTYVLRDIRCPVCNRLQMRAAVQGMTHIQIKCRCKSMLKITATGIGIEVRSQYIQPGRVSC